MSTNMYKCTLCTMEISLTSRNSKSNLMAHINDCHRDHPFDEITLCYHDMPIQNNAPPNYVAQCKHCNKVMVNKTNGLHTHGKKCKDMHDAEWNHDTNEDNFRLEQRFTPVPYKKRKSQAPDQAKLIEQMQVEDADNYNNYSSPNRFSRLDDGENDDEDEDNDESQNPYLNTRSKTSHSSSGSSSTLLKTKKLATNARNTRNSTLAKSVLSETSTGIRRTPSTTPQSSDSNGKNVKKTRRSTTNTRNRQYDTKLNTDDEEDIQTSTSRSVLTNGYQNKIGTIQKNKNSRTNTPTRRMTTRKNAIDTREKGSKILTPNESRSPQMLLSSPTSVGQSETQSRHLAKRKHESTRSRGKRSGDTPSNKRGKVDSQISTLDIDTQSIDIDRTHTQESYASMLRRTTASSTSPELRSRQEQEEAVRIAATYGMDQPPDYNSPSDMDISLDEEGPKESPKDSGNGARRSLRVLNYTKKNQTTVLSSTPSDSDETYGSTSGDSIDIPRVRKGNGASSSSYSNYKARQRQQKEQAKAASSRSTPRTTSKGTIPKAPKPKAMKPLGKGPSKEILSFLAGSETDESNQSDSYDSPSSPSDGSSSSSDSEEGYITDPGPEEPLEDRNPLPHNIILEQRYVDLINDGIGTLGKPCHWLHSSHKTKTTHIFTILMNEVTRRNALSSTRQRAAGALWGLPGIIASYKEIQPTKTISDYISHLYECRNDIYTMAHKICNDIVILAAMKQRKEQALFEKQEAARALIGNDAHTTTKAPTQENCAKAINDGRLSKVLRQMDSHGDGLKGVFSGTIEETRNHISTLHPQATYRDNLPPLTPEFFMQDVHQYTIEETNNILHRLPYDSSNGVSGWTYGLMRRAAMTSRQTPDGPQLEEAFLDFVQMMANYEVPDEVNDFIMESRSVLIHPDPEKPAKIRPIGIDDSIVRFVHRVELNTRKAALQEHLEPIQMCGGTPGGCEIMGSVAQLNYNARLATWVGDFKNGFNTPARSTVQTRVANICAGLLPYLHRSYGRPTVLRSSTREGRNKRVGLSATGVRQGDPLSMIFFALTIHPTLVRINRIIDDAKQEELTRPNTTETELSLCITRPGISAFADDVNATTSNKLLSTLLPIIRRITRDELPGMSWCWPKCLISGLTVTDDIKIPLIQAIELEITNLEEHQLGGTEHASLETELQGVQALPVVTTGCITVGIPIGTQEFIKEQLDIKMQKYTRTLQHFKNSNLHAQTLMALLKKCISVRPYYLARNVDPHYSNEAFTKWDKAVDDALAYKLLSNCPVDSTLSILRSLPYHLGGCNIPRMVGPTAIIAYKKRNEMVNKFANKAEVQWADLGWLTAVDQNEYPYLHTRQSSCNTLTEREMIHNPNNGYGTLTRILLDFNVNRLLIPATLPGKWAPDDYDDDYDDEQGLQRNDHVAQLDIAYKTLFASMLRAMIKPYLYQQGDPERIALMDTSWGIHPMSLISRILYLLSSIYDRDKDHDTGNSVSGMILDWHGGFDHRTRINHIDFIAYLKARLLIPQTNENKFCPCNIDDNGRQERGVRMDFRHEPYHPLNCRRVGTPAFAKHRSSEIERLTADAAKVQAKARNTQVDLFHVAQALEDNDGQYISPYHSQAHHYKELLRQNVMALPYEFIHPVTRVRLEPDVVTRTNVANPGQQQMLPIETTIIDITVVESATQRFIQECLTNNRPITYGAAIVRADGIKQMKYAPICGDNTTLRVLSMTSTGVIGREGGAALRHATNFGTGLPIQGTSYNLHALRKQIAYTLAKYAGKLFNSSLQHAVPMVDPPLFEDRPRIFQNLENAGHAPM